MNTGWLLFILGFWKSLTLNVKMTLTLYLCSLVVFWHTHPLQKHTCINIVKTEPRRTLLHSAITLSLHFLQLNLRVSRSQLPILRGGEWRFQCWLQFCWHNQIGAGQEELCRYSTSFWKYTDCWQLLSWWFLPHGSCKILQVGGSCWQICPGLPDSLQNSDA